MDQPPKCTPLSGGAPHDGSVGSGADRDVVGVTEDPVGPKSGYDRWPLLLHDGRDCIDQLLEGHVGNAAVGIAEPVVPVRNPSDRLNRRARPQPS